MPSLFSRFRSTHLSTDDHGSNHCSNTEQSNNNNNNNPTFIQTKSPSSSMNETNSSSTTVVANSSSPSTPSPTSLYNNFEKKYDLESNLAHLGQIFNTELCHTDISEQKFERDLMRMLKVISLVCVKKPLSETCSVTSRTILSDESVEQLVFIPSSSTCHGDVKRLLTNDLFTTPRIFEMIPWRRSSQEQQNNGISMFMELLNGLGKLFNDSCFHQQHSNNSDTTPNHDHSHNHVLYYESLTENDYFEALNHVPSTLDESDMKKVLTKLYSPNHPEILRYLCGIAQLVVVSTLGKIAAAILQSKVPLQPKDVRGSWSVEFRRYEEGADPDGCSFGILHQRTDCIMKKESPSILKPVYNFQWQIEIKFKTIAINSVDVVTVRLLNIDWILDPTLKISDTEKEELISICKKFFSFDRANNKLHEFDKTCLVPSGRVLIECSHKCDGSTLPCNIDSNMETATTPRGSDKNPPIVTTTNDSSKISVPKHKTKSNEMGWLKKLLMSSSTSSEEIFETLSSYKQEPSPNTPRR
ncbi:hypothetical protein FDP41_010768 [Naegleria fowleri]|uniref:Uncharacterized protein n=1 Tax=Naegleria fowleri TaxID=5763 RepID=A0A6A5CBZ8_NAEFO|nr:uncharacterized protein FDP41_010768 [Naegleria fowleri]KAF0982789.1 hypothetical protein FDP41_010768 [Naegleria fowleri]